MEPEQSSINRRVDVHTTLLAEVGQIRWAGTGRGKEGGARGKGGKWRGEKEKKGGMERGGGGAFRGVGMIPNEIDL